jgi:hypothetical protein
MRLSHHPNPLLGLLLAGVCTVAQATQDYAIQLVRRAKAGEHYGMVAKGSEAHAANVTVDGKPMPPRLDSMAVDFTAEVEVLAISPKGHEKKTKFIVSKATRTVGDETVGLLSPGTPIIAERNQTKTEFLVNGIPAAPDVAKALALVIHLDSDEVVSDDDVFGTLERKHVGDSWSVNAPAAAADLAHRHQITVDTKNLTGDVTLTKVVKAGDDECLIIAATIDVKDPIIPLPPGLKVQSSMFSGKLIGWFPVDSNQPVRRQSMHLDAKIVCAGVPRDRDQEMSMVTTMKRDREVTCTPKSGN